MRTAVLSLSLLGISCLPPVLAAAQPSQSHPRVVTTTRLVAEYSDLEQQLNRAIQHRDEAAVGKLLADDFEQWTPTPPGDPVPREDWLHHALTSFTLRSIRVRQMAVGMVGETAVVSFVQDQQATCENGRDCSGSHFIVDLWQPHNGVPQLHVRYDSEKLAQRAPSSPPKPTGKE